MDRQESASEVGATTRPINILFGTRGQNASASLPAPKSKDDQLRDYSFDEDLDWILGKLVKRLGGVLGLVSRYSTVEGCHEVLGLSMTSPNSLQTDTLAHAVISGADHGRSATHRRRGDDDEADVQCNELAGVPHHFLLAMTFDVSPSVHLLVSIVRPKSKFGIVEQGTATIFHSVLSRYFKLWWMHRTEKGQTRILSRALNSANVGVMILDARTKILFANSLAFDIIDGKYGLRRHEGKLSAARLEDDVRLQTAIQHAVRRPKDRSGIDGSSSPVVPIYDDHVRRPLIVSVTASGERVLDNADASAIIYLLDPESDVASLVRPICDVYSLTPVETQLACHIVEGLTTKEAAGKMRIQPETARAYLKNIFSKTMTNRQAELVKIMLSSALRMNTNAGSALL